MNNNSIREKLYHDYIRELGNYNPEFLFYSDEELKKNYEEVSNWYDITWFDVYYGAEIVGFIIITTGDHCPVDYDYYIAETFVLPEYRNKGLMTGVLNKIIHDNHGTYGLYIINSNKKAINFWHNFYKKNEHVQKQATRKGSQAWRYNCIEESFITKFA